MNTLKRTLALVATQVVSGTNYLILSKSTSKDTDSLGFYVLVTLYEDLDGHARITDIAESQFYLPLKNAVGAWTDKNQGKITSSIQTIFEKAVNDEEDEDYKAIALLGTQVVSGTNYSILVKRKLHSDQIVSSYAILVVYQNLKGEVTINDIYEFNNVTTYSI